MNCRPPIDGLIGFGGVFKSEMRLGVRMISVLALRTTSPARVMIPARSAFRRLLTHSPPKASCFSAELRLNDNIAMGHQAAFAPNWPEGSLPARVVKLLFKTLIVPPG